jgi:hypothetical protein
MTIPAKCECLRLTVTLPIDPHQLPCLFDERMRRDREAYADALATVEQFKARLSAKNSAWFWPTIAAAHH